MPLTYEKKRITRSVITKAVCDMCKEELEVYEHGGHEGKLIEHTGGFASMYDMTQISALFCDDCLYSLLSPYMLVKSYWESTHE